MLHFPSAVGSVSPAALRAVYNPPATPADGFGQLPIETLAFRDAADRAYQQTLDADVYARLVASAAIPSIVGLLEPLFPTSEDFELQQAAIVASARDGLITLIGTTAKPRVVAPYNVVAAVFQALQTQNAANNALPNYAVFDDEFRELIRDDDILQTTAIDYDSWWSFVRPSEVTLANADASELPGVVRAAMEALFDRNDLDGGSLDPLVRSLSTTAASPSTPNAPVGENVVRVQNRLPANALADQDVTFAEATSFLNALARVPPPIRASKKGSGDQFLDADNVALRSMVGDRAHIANFFGGFSDTYELNLRTIQSYHQRTQQTLQRAAAEARRTESDTQQYKAVFDALLANNAWEGVGLTRSNSRIQQYRWLHRLLSTVSESHSNESPLSVVVPAAVDLALNNPATWRSDAHDIRRFASVMSTLEPETIRTAVCNDTIQRWRGTAHAMLLSYLLATQAAVQCIVARRAIAKTLTQQNGDMYELLLSKIVAQVITQHRDARDAMLETLLHMTGPDPWEPAVIPAGQQGAVQIEHVGDSIRYTDVGGVRRNIYRYAGPITEFDVRVMNAYMIQLQRDAILVQHYMGVRDSTLIEKLDLAQEFLLYAFQTTNAVSTLGVQKSKRSLARFMLEQMYYPLVTQSGMQDVAEYQQWLKRGANQLLGEAVVRFYRMLQPTATDQWEQTYGLILQPCASVFDHAIALVDAATAQAQDSFTRTYVRKTTVSVYLSEILGDVLDLNQRPPDTSNPDEYAEYAAALMLGGPDALYTIISRVAESTKQTTLDVWNKTSLRFGNKSLRNVLLRRFPCVDPVLFIQRDKPVIAMPAHETQGYWAQFARVFLGQAAAQVLPIASAQQQLDDANNPTLDKLSLRQSLFAPIETSLQRIVAGIRAGYWRAAVDSSRTTAEQQIERQLTNAYGRPMSPQAQQNVFETMQKVYSFSALVPTIDTFLRDAVKEDRILYCQWYVQDQAVFEPIPMVVSQYATYVSSSIQVAMDAFSTAPISPRNRSSVRIQNYDKSGELRIQALITASRTASPTNTTTPASSPLLSPRAALVVRQIPDAEFRPFVMSYTTHVPVRAAFIVHR